MNKQYFYTVLKYRPSYLLEEQVNIGLLFIFPGTEEIRFLYPTHLGRVSKLYPDADLPLLKRYLKTFERVAKKIQLAHYAEKLPSITTAFIPKDASSLYFSDFKSGTYADVSTLLKYYKDLYFGVYLDHSKKRKDKAYLKKAFNQRLRKFSTSPEKLKLFKEDIEIPNRISTTRFDYIWQNGRTNFVKFNSFDLQDEHYLQEKAFKLWGEISSLNGLLKTDSYQIDILVSKPRKKSLFPAYDKALQLLESLTTQHRITEEEALDDYVHEAIDTVRPLNEQALSILTKK